MSHPETSHKSFFFMGDLALSGDIRLEDLRSISQPIRGMMSSEDFLFANLEIPITKAPFNPVHFGDEEIMERGLAQLGVTHINLANNHILDSGKEGLTATIAMLDRLNIKHTGAGISPEHCEPMVLEWNGRNVAIMGFVHLGTNIKNLDITDVLINVWEERKAKTIIESWKSRGFDVWVSMHWGEDYSHYVAPYQKKIAEDIALWGGSLILGHHAHVVQPMRKDNDCVVFHGLGGYVFGNFWKRDQWCSLFKKTKKGLVVQAKISERDGLSFYYYCTRESWSHHVSISPWNFSYWSQWHWFCGKIKYSTSSFKKLFSIFEKQSCRISHQTSMFGTSFWSVFLRSIKSGE